MSAEEIVRLAAVGSLKKLTGQDVAYDPFSKKKDELRSGQRRWQDWWRKNSATF